MGIFVLMNNEGGATPRRHDPLIRIAELTEIVRLYVEGHKKTCGCMGCEALYGPRKDRE